MRKADVLDFYRRLAERDPAPRTELDWTNPYTLLVAVALSAQATDVGVNKATRRLFAEVDTPARMVALGEAGLKAHIRTIGLFNTKARNVIALSEQLIARHGGAVPRDRAALEALPGVGRKTANVVLNVAFGEETIAVDTHIFRVANRTGLAPGKDVRAVEDRLVAATPAPFRAHAHHWLILHGRYVLQGAAARMLALHRSRPLCVPPQDARARCAAHGDTGARMTLSNLPLALLLLAAGVDGLAARPPAVPPAQPDGKPESCIPIRQITTSRVRDDRTIDFFLGRRVYRNILPYSCPELGFEQAFSYTTSLSELCSTDIITVFHNGGTPIRGASCGLGAFQPVTGVR